MLSEDELLAIIKENFFDWESQEHQQGALDLLDKLISKRDPHLLAYVYRKLLGKTQPYYIIVCKQSQNEFADRPPQEYTELIPVLFETKTEAEAAAKKGDIPESYARLLFEPYMIQEI